MVRETGEGEEGMNGLEGSALRRLKKAKGCLRQVLGAGALG